jgi:hypothetical protein
MAIPYLLQTIFCSLLASASQATFPSKEDVFEDYKHLFCH